MRKIIMTTAILAAVSIQPIFAWHHHQMHSRACNMIANACTHAGYAKGDYASNKGFWFNCMRPILLNRTVSGVNVDAATVRTCRMDKINEKQRELASLQRANQ